jgi:hypothetical protein
MLRGFLRTSGNVNTAFFGVRPGTSPVPQDERQVGPSPENAYQEVDIPFNSGSNSIMTAFVGFWGLGSDGWIQIDSITVHAA